jgi:hypothetical protein
MTGNLGAAAAEKLGAIIPRYRRIGMRYCHDRRTELDYSQRGDARNSVRVGAPNRVNRSPQAADGRRPPLVLDDVGLKRREQRSEVLLLLMLMVEAVSYHP